MKTISSIFTLLFIFTNSFSQNLLIVGDTIKVTQDPCFETNASLTITNNSNNTLDINCEKVIIDTTLGTQNYFCWGAECYGPNQYVSSSFNTLNPGESDNIDFGGYYNAFCSSASATIQYCFYPLSNINDRSCINITYNGSITSTSLLQSSFLSIYPNPSNNNISVNLVNDEIKNVIILNMFGQKIIEKYPHNQNNLKFNLSDYPNGTYFIVAIKNDLSRTVKRFILE